MKPKSPSTGGLLSAIAVLAVFLASLSAATSVRQNSGTNLSLPGAWNTLPGPAWKQDYPNIRNYFMFQIWPQACGDTSRNDLLREVQRVLPTLFSNMRIMSTLGISPGSSCHYVPAGYAKFSDLITPFVLQDVYGQAPAGVITAPNPGKIYYTTAARDEIALEFGQAMVWNNLSKGLFFLDGVEFDRADASLAPATTLTLEYGSTLGVWTTIPIPETSAGPVSITPPASPPTT